MENTSDPEVTKSVENTSDPLLGVLISGRGSNLQAIVDAIREGRLQARIAVVISNHTGAPGLERARAAGVDAIVMSHRDHPSREAYDKALAVELHRRGVQLVCLAGFMRMLGSNFCEAFPQAVLNVHPSLLPSFPGAEAPWQALTHGVKVSGATVHFVTPELDAGPIIVQAAVPVKDDDTPETLGARILAEEHRLYPEAIAMVLGGRCRIDGRRVVPVAARTTTRSS